jgi:hypothetical protein
MAVELNWDQDPSVQAMRRVFSRMEIAQKELLKQLNISHFDERLRVWRQTALELFERSCANARQQNIALDEEKIAGIYLHCLARTIGSGDIAIARDSLPRDEKIEKLVEETQQ